jgi:hypothetical protein
MENNKEQINITLNADGEVARLIIQHQEGPKPIDPKPPVQVKINGEIEAPVLFAKGQIKNETLSFEKSLVTYNMEAGSITLKVDPSDQLAPEVNGSLRKHPDLTKLKISEEHYFDKDSFRALIKSSSHLFEDIQTAKMLDAVLRNFVAKVEEEVKLTDDEKGNSTANAIRKVELHGELLKPRTLKCPFFVGGVEETIEVEINCHPNRIAFTFESWTFKKEFEDRKKAEMNRVLSDLRELDFTTIEIF